MNLEGSLRRGIHPLIRKADRAFLLKKEGTSEGTGMDTNVPTILKKTKTL